jgi:phage-related holin
MAGKKSLQYKYFSYIEVVIFIIVAFFGRRLLDTWLLTLGFSGLVNTLVRILFVLAIIAIAVFLDRVLSRYLIDKGWVRE